MKTYTETQGKKPFDCNAFLNKEEISEQEWEYAENLAGSWVTCACGNQCDVIERRPINGVPKDEELFNLGMWFSVSIDNKDIEKAKETLLKIEKRSAELINQINSKK